MDPIQAMLKPERDYSWPGNTHESIILHTTLGNSYIGAHETLRIRHLSYHFIIDEDGEVYQLTDINRSAWHAGVKSKPNLRVRSFFGSDNPNRRSIGIAFVRNGHDRITGAQRDAAVSLIKWLGAQTGVRYNRDNIFAHYEVTDYKPYEVLVPYRDQVVEGLEGYKDEADAGQKSQMLLIIQLLQTIISELIKRKNVEDNN